MSLQDSFFNDNRDNRDNFCVQCICFNAMPLFQCEACCLYCLYCRLMHGSKVEVAIVCTLKHKDCGGGEA